MAHNRTELAAPRAPFRDHLSPFTVTTQTICATLDTVVRAVGFLFLWLAGIAAAVTVAWAGVNAVDDDLVDPAPAAGVNGSGIAPTPGLVLGDSAGAGQALRGEAAADGNAADTGTPAGASDSAGTASGASATPESGAVSQDGDSSAGTSSSDTSGTPPTSASAPTPTTGSSTPSISPPPTSPTPPTTSTTQPSATTAPTTTTPVAQTLTFNLDGGSAAITFAPTGTSLSWASPNPGYEMTIDTDDGEVTVRFQSSEHESRVDGWWLDGPKFRIREQPGNGPGTDTGGSTTTTTP